MNTTIETPEQALDTILEMVKWTEEDHELAVSAAATIYSLFIRGYSDLSLAVLETYRPNAMKRPWMED
jgi:hypothetical protein